MSQRNGFQNFFSGQQNIQRDISQNSNKSSSQNRGQSKEKAQSNIRLQYKRINPKGNNLQKYEQKSQKKIETRTPLMDNFQKDLALIKEKQSETVSNGSTQQHKMSSFNIASEISLDNPKMPSILQNKIQYTTSITTDQRQFINHSFKQDKQKLTSPSNQNNELLYRQLSQGRNQEMEEIKNQQNQIKSQREIQQPKFSQKIMRQLSDKKSKKSFKEEFSMNEFEDKDIIQLMKIRNGKLVLNTTALEYIKSIKQKICVLSVIGPYRSGKSFLLNRFQNQQKGFALGNTTNPCTEGVWFWGVKDYKQDKVILLIDTEGLFAFNRDEQQDIKLFLFTAMISSMMIYNTFGVIDESSLERLDFVTRLGSYFGFINNKKLLNEKELTYYFPHLIWLLRDFTLELKDDQQNIKLTSSEYLERTLTQKQKNFQDDVIKNINESVLKQSNSGEQNNLRSSKKLKQEQQNNIRKQIKNIFKKRTCKTLVRPVFEERKLRNIDKIDYNELRGEFIDQLQDLQDYVYMNIEEKQVRNKAINGQLFVKYIQMVADSLNQNKIPEMKSMWRQIEDFQITKIQKHVEEMISQRLSIIIDQLPMKQSQIKQNYIELKDNIVNYLLRQDLELNLIQRVLESIQKQLDNFLLQITNKNTKLKNEKIQKNFEKVQEVFESQQHSQQNWQLYEDAIMSHINENFQSNQKAIAQRKLFQMIFQKIDSQQKHQYIQQQDQEIKMGKLQGQYQATKSLLEQQKKVIESVISQTQLSQQKSLENFETQLQEQKSSYQIKIMELEDKLKQYEQSGNNLNKNSTIQSFKDIQNQVEIKNKLDQILSQLDQQNNHRKQKPIEINTGQFQECFNQIKIENQTEIEQIKGQYQIENSKLKKNNEELKRILNESKILLLKKDSEIKILQEKIRSENKYRNTQIEFSDTLCNISDQIMNLLKKMEGKIQKQLIQFTIQ